ncbi:MAG TPA: hypothetical protein VFO29_09505 [Candidatus Rubrimentiphilum sp.]|nr:hypothetical protein [Candidatus Rubrimentiphilum sp.]
MSVPAAVVLAASLAARDHTGIIGYRIQRTVDMAAGPIRRHEDVLLAAVFENDRLVRIRVLRDMVSGRSTGTPAQEALERQLLAASKEPGFAVPFDARYLHDYTYRVAGNLVAFSSALKDARHADGYFVLGSGGMVTQLQYALNVLPKYATAGTVHEDRAEVLPHYWATVRSTQLFEGRYAIFQGRGEFVTVDSGFRRFGTVDAATAWLQAERP